MTTPNGPTNGPEVGTTPGRVVEADLPPSSPWHKATWGNGVLAINCLSCKNVDFFVFLTYS